MGARCMDARYLSYHRIAATQRRPAFRAPNAGGRGRFLWERRGEPQSGPRRAPNAPDLSPDPERNEPGGPEAA